MDYGEAVSEFEEFFDETYYSQVSAAVKNGDGAVVVDFQDLDMFSPEVTDYLTDNPDSAVEAAEEGLQVHDQVNDEDLGVRIGNFPEHDYVLLRNLRSEHIGKFVPVEGMIKRASQVKPEVVSAVFECSQCGDLYEKEQDSSKLKSPYKCECGSKKFEVQEKIMTDTQVVTLEENPESREGSEQPTSLSVRLEGALVDPEFQKRVVPGNVVEVTGKIRETPLQKDSKKYDIYMEANHVNPTQQEFEQLELTQEEIDEIKEMAEDEDIFESINNSIAPSIYGHDRIKEAIALQMFGGVKKTRDDGVKSRGDLHILLIGEPGTGKCVAPDTEIISTEGERYEIGELVNNRIESSNEVKEIDDGVYVEEEIETLGIDDKGKIEEKNSSKMWKRDAPEKMFKIKTNSGREVEVTPSHPLFTQKDGNIIAKKAEGLSEGQFIAAPRELEIREDNSLEASYRKSKANNAIRLDAPKELNPGFSRLLGYMAAEGYIQKTDHNSNTLYFTNNDKELLMDVSEQLDRLSVNYTQRPSHEGKSAKEIHCSASELISFLENVAPSLVKRSREREIPDTVFSASDKNVKNFIMAFVESEGTVSRKEREICIGSTSKKILEDLRTCLLRFGIQSQLKPRTGSYRLRISGHDFDEYVQNLGFITERKKESSTAFDSVNNTNTDVVPQIGDKLREVREALGMTQFDFSIGRGAYQHYERLDRNPSLGNLKTVSSDFRERVEYLERIEEELNEASWNKIKAIRKELKISQANLAEDIDTTQSTVGNYEMGKTKSQNVALLNEASEELQSVIQQKLAEVKTELHKIEQVANSDIFWDKIESIEQVEPEYDYVYDLEIPKYHNYITNGILSHNSQLLKFTGEIAPKGRYVVGKSSTGAGLTASVVKEESTGEFSLEAGAVVLAHKGMAAIDEIDKMDKEDRSSLHEAMEQQQISVSKANIQATLNAETSILAAGNPKLGRFDPYEPIAEQINIGDTLLSRFDFIFPVMDEPDQEKDTELADKILQNHIDPEETEAEIPGEKLRKYIAFAKKNRRPQLTPAASDKIQEFYVSMRQKGDDEGGGVPITARQLEATIRTAEASARAHLNKEVTVEDAERAIDLLTYSLKLVGMDPETGEFDIDRIESGISSSERNRLQTVKHIIQELAGDEDSAEIEEVLEQADQEGIAEEKAEEIIEKLKREGELFEPQQGHIQRI
ncbi:MAG: LAGLIDADG family homing endonuclease [Candidatus Nanohalobium sp.]